MSDHIERDEIRGLPYQLLKRLGSERLPVTIHDEDDIEKLSVLAVMGLVEAEIPRRAMSMPYVYQKPAVVLRVISTRPHGR